MKRAIIPTILIPVLLSALLAACCCVSGPDCCDKVVPDSTGPKLSGTVCFWISADKDTYASYGRVGEEVDRNFGSGSFLAVANGPLGRKQSYVHFTPPTFPAGTEIIEAKFEMFHSGKNEDGTTDDITLNVSAIRNETWSPLMLTWKNRPDRDGIPVNDTEIRLRSQDWSGTPDISGLVGQMLASPGSYHGFVVSYRDPSGRQVEKGFHSNNERHRTQTDLGFAPRLLVRVQLPEGVAVSQTSLTPLLPPDNDITAPGNVTMVRTRQSTTWPADWKVSP